MPPTKQKNPEQLRIDAEGRLRNRTAPLAAGWTISPEALSLLYRLSSDVENPGDALKLLHELQTHQVELDLQHAQLIENEHELSSQVAHYLSLYEMLPAAYLVLGRDGRILQSNRAATHLFGLDGDRLKGNSLTSLLAPESRQAIMALLKAPEDSANGEDVHVHALDSQPLRLVSGFAPQDDAILMLILPEGSAGRG